MAFRYSDQEIARRVLEPKFLPADSPSRPRLRPKRGHKERDLDIRGERGNEFRLILRQSIFSPLDFSIILAYRSPYTNRLFRLRRYDGKSHEHTNRIEGNTFYDFHIHIATARYQELGMAEDAYAEPTDRFSDIHSAAQCLFEDCGVEIPRELQGVPFEER